MVFVQLSKRRGLTPFAMGVASLALLVAPSLFTSASATTTAPAFDYGSDLPIGSTFSDSVRGTAMDVATGSGMTMFVADAKDGSGKAGWYTTSFPMSGSAYTLGNGAVERAVRDGHARGLKVAARFAVFNDAYAASLYPSHALAGTPYMDPACSDVRAHEVAMVKDLVARTGVDEVILDYVRYNPTLPGTTVLPCTGGTVSQVTSARADNIASFASEVKSAMNAARPGVKLGASVFPQALTTGLAAYGQDAVKMAPSVDVFMPMIYPMNFAGQDPYKLTYDFVAAGVAKFGGARVRPWIQGESDYAGDATKVCVQVKAVRDAGGSGALPWWFISMGTTQSVWDAIGACAHPAAATTTTTTPPPPPPPPAFAATFTAQATRSGWVEANVSGNQPLAGVSVNANGVALGPLKLLAGTAWGASYTIAAGSQVRFTAASTSGEFAVSPTLTWATLAPPAPPAFAATFSANPTRAGWMEVNVSANEPLAAVSVNANGVALGGLKPLGGKAWGAFINVPSGALVKFTAKSTSGAFATSPTTNWVSLFTATVTMKSQTRNALTVGVTANEAIGSVLVSVNGGTSYAMTKATTGAVWSKSIYLPAGARILVTVRATSGHVTAAAFTAR